MPEWNEYLFSDLLENETISYGIVQPGSHSVTNSIPVIRVNNIKRGYIRTEDVLRVTPEVEAKYKKTRLVGGELLITVVGSVGECAIVPENLKGWNVARAVSVARIKREFDSRFIKYIFKTEEIKYQLYGNTNDTVQPTLNLASLKNLKINAPSLYYQKEIADILDSLDNKIELLHRNRRTLESLAESLFRNQFDIENNITKANGVLGDYFIDTIGGQWGKERPDGDHVIEVKCIRGTDIGNLEEGIPNPPVRYIKEALFQKCQLIDGDIVIEISGGTEDQSTGRSHYFDLNIINLLDGRLVFSNFCRLLRPKHANYTYFLHIYLNLIYKRGDFFNLENGTSGIKNLDLKSFLYKELIYQPSKDQILSFNELVKPFFLKSSANLLQIKNLETLRDTLLPKLMSGAVTIKTIADELVCS